MSENVTIVKSGLPYIFPKQLIDLTGIDHLDEADWVDYAILSIGFIALIWWLTTRMPMIRVESGPDDDDTTNTSSKDDESHKDYDDNKNNNDKKTSNKTKDTKKTQ